MKSLATLRMFTLRVRIQRAGPVDVSTSIRTGLETVYDSILITEVYPISESTINRLLIETPVDMFEAFTDEGFDIRPGDTVYVHDSGKRYIVRNCNKWPTSLLELVLEYVRTNG